MRSRVNDLPIEREVSSSFVDVGQDRFVLLCEECNEIHLAVPIQVGRDDVDTTWPRVDDVPDELRPCRDRCSIFVHCALPRRVPSECCDGEIVLSVAVEVGGLNVSDSWPVVQPERTVFSAGLPAQPDCGAFTVIGWKELAEFRDEQIALAISIQV